MQDFQIYDTQNVRNLDQRYFTPARSLSDSLMLPFLS